jgi:hypothetical protein
VVSHWRKIASMTSVEATVAVPMFALGRAG